MTVSWCSAQRISTLAAVLALLAGIGCVSWPYDEALEIQLVDLSAAESTLFETTLTARIRIMNPNPEALTFEGAAFKIELEGRKVGSGTVPETFAVERLSSAVVDATFHLSHASLLMRLREIIEADDVSYGLRGTFWVQGPWGTQRHRVQRIGRVDLKGGLVPIHEREDDLDTID